MTLELNPTTTTVPTDHANARHAAEQLLRDLDDFVSGYPDPVFSEAIRSQVTQFKEMIGDLLSERVTIRSVQQVRDASHGMFTKLAQRAIAWIGKARVHAPAHATVYRSAFYFDCHDYFNRSFIDQLNVHRRIAIDVVATEAGVSPANLIQTERMMVVPNRLHPDHATDVRAIIPWWRQAVPEIDVIAAESALLCVPDGALEAGWNGDSIVDFGLYGDVAVGVYRYTKWGEEFCLYSVRSEMFHRCERTWDRMIYAGGPIDWSEFKSRLGIDIIT